MQAIADPFVRGAGTFTGWFLVVFAAWIAIAIGNGLWSWRLQAVARRYDELHVSLGGASIGGARAGSVRRSPLVRPGWLSVVPFAVFAGLMASQGFGGFELALSGIIVAVLLGQALYLEFVSRWSRRRRLLRPAVLSFDGESRELLIREALAADPDVGEKAPNAVLSPGSLPPPGIGTDVAESEGLPAAVVPAKATRGPRFSQAPPPV